MPGAIIFVWMEEVPRSAASTRFVDPMTKWHGRRSRLASAVYVCHEEPQLKGWLV
jgi:hypothetical protein